MSAVHNGNLNYIVRGKGPPVILIHGMAASSYDWLSLMPGLIKAGYRTYAVDLLGHGDSAKPSDPTLYTSNAVYMSLEKWLESLNIDQSYILVGHSLGGYLSLEHGLRHPQKVRAMVLLDPFYNPTQLQPLLRFLNRRPSLGVKTLEITPPKFIDALLGWDPTTRAHFSPQARLQIAIDYKRASPYILNIPRTIPNITPELDLIHIPSLVIWGDRDLTLNPKSFPELVSALPKARGQVVSGCGHQPHIGNPELVNRLVLDFLAEL